ncbi:hypothetical protein Bbelb_358660 [Branchiostoma belcheri]|nr:hypothetical protein Bbelb_358660 [Branchiostoma belcheri]
MLASPTEHKYVKEGSIDTPVNNHWIDIRASEVTWVQRTCGVRNASNAHDCFVYISDPASEVPGCGHAPVSDRVAPFDDGIPNRRHNVVKKAENKLEPLTLGGSGPLSWADEMEMEESLQTKSPATSPTSTSPPPTTPWGTNAWPQRAPDVTSIETSVMAQQKTKLRTGKGANFLAIDISPDGNWVEDKPVKKKRKPRRDENFAVKTAA